jgi:hypothetical protein
MEAVAAVADPTANHVDFPPTVTKTKRVWRRPLSRQTPSVTASDGSRSSTSSRASHASFKSTDSRGARRGRKQWIRAEREILDDPYRSAWRLVRHDTETSSLPSSAHGLPAAPTSNSDGSGLVMKRQFIFSPIIGSVALKEVKLRPSSSVSYVLSSTQLSIIS